MRPKTLPVELSDTVLAKGLGRRDCGSRDTWKNAQRDSVTEEMWKNIRVMSGDWKCLTLRSVERVLVW